MMAAQVTPPASIGQGFIQVNSGETRERPLGEGKWRGATGRPSRRRQSASFSAIASLNLCAPRYVQSRVGRGRVLDTDCSHSVVAWCSFPISANQVKIIEFISTDFGGAVVPEHAAAAAAAAASASVAMNQLGTVYATKRRRRNGKRC